MLASNVSGHCFGFSCKETCVGSSPKLRGTAGDRGFDLCQKECHLSVRVRVAEISSAAILLNGVEGVTLSKYKKKKYKIT